MTEFTGMSAADIAATEYCNGHGDHDDQPFEGNIILFDARALSDTDRTVVESMREEFDAEVVVLPHSSVMKKKMRRSKATISDVGLNEIGDYIEPGSKIAVIPGPGLPDASRDSVLASIPDDCTSEVVSASSLQAAMDGLGKFFGVRRSQEATTESGPTLDDALEELGVDDKSAGNKSGYGIDAENGRMGVWSVKPEGGEMLLSYPLALTSIKGVDEASSQEVVKQAAIWIEEREREVDLSGKLIDDRVVLGAITEQDAKLPGPRQVRRSEPIPFSDLRKPDLVLKELGLTGDMPVPDSPTAKNAFFQMIVGTSQTYEYPTTDVYQATGWLDTKSHGSAFISSDGALIPDETGFPMKVSDICGYTPSHPKTGEDISIPSAPEIDFAEVMTSLSAFFDSLNGSGCISVGTYLAGQAACMAGASSVALLSIFGAASSGKSTAVAWANMSSSTQEPESFMSIESTDNAMKSSMEAGSGIPAIIDDFRVVKDEKKATAMASAISTGIRVAYASTGAGRKRMTSTTDKGVRSAQSRNEVNLRPLIVLTSEDPLATYTHISASDRTRLFEIPFDDKPTDDGGVAMSNAHSSGAFTALSSQIIGKAMIDLGEKLNRDGAKRMSTAGLRKMQDERVASLRRSMDEAPHQEIRVEKILGFMRFGAQQIIDALSMDTEVQNKARKVFEDAERSLWIPQVDKIVRQVGGGELTLGAEVIDSMAAMEGVSLRILREGETRDSKKGHSSMRGDSDLRVVARVVTTRTGDRGRVLAISPTRLEGSGALGRTDSPTIRRNLMTIRGAYKGSAKMEPGEKLATSCVLVPIENTGIPIDSVLFKKFDDDEECGEVSGDDDF